MTKQVLVSTGCEVENAQVCLEAGVCLVVKWNCGGLAEVSYNETREKPWLAPGLTSATGVCLLLYSKWKRMVV